MMEKKIALTKQTTENKLAEMESQLHNQIATIEAQNQKTIAEMNAKKNAQVQKISSEAKNQVDLLNAETQHYVRTKMAEAQLAVSKFQAEALEAEAEAEEKMSKMLVAKRQYETDNQRLSVLENMCQNENLIIAGSNGILSKSTDLAAVSMPTLAYEQMILDSVTSLAKSLPSTDGEGATIQQSMMLDSLHGMYSSRKR